MKLLGDFCAGLLGKCREWDLSTSKVINDVQLPILHKLKGLQIHSSNLKAILYYKIKCKF